MPKDGGKSRTILFYALSALYVSSVATIVLDTTNFVIGMVNNDSVYQNVSFALTS